MVRGKRGERAQVPRALLRDSHSLGGQPLSVVGSESAFTPKIVHTQHVMIPFNAFSVVS